MWLLIVTSFMYASGTGESGHILTFQTFETKERCVQMARYVNTKYAKEYNKTVAECVRNQ